jgi:hypothetical protein
MLIFLNFLKMIYFKSFTLQIEVQLFSFSFFWFRKYSQSAAVVANSTLTWSKLVQPPSNSVLTSSFNQLHFIALIYFRIGYLFKWEPHSVKFIYSMMIFFCAWYIFIFNWKGWAECKLVERQRERESEGERETQSVATKGLQCGQ